ncbi:MAG: ferritin-like domain-containing protein [Pseudomonadota bacterium]
MRWTLDDIAWQRFDAVKVDCDLIKVVKTAALVEANSADYVTYLKNVFPEDADFCAAIEQWGAEEAQHGASLGRWAEMADPDFSFEEALRVFRAGYQLDLDTGDSVRGSRLAELIARSVVESGTSSFYSAIRDASAEPVLKQIAHRIAADEFAHYQLFQRHLKHYEASERLNRMKRLHVAVTRVQEAEDEELAYAYFAANVQRDQPGAVFDCSACSAAYYRLAMHLYEERHIENATRMILRAANFDPDSKIADFAARGFWRFVQYKRERMAKLAA